MNSFTEKYDPDQLQPDELSEREKQILETHLNLERRARWRKVAGPKPTIIQTIFGKKMWGWWALAILLGILLCWQAGWFSTDVNTERQLIAARTDLIEYRFDNITVRGEQNAKGFAHSAKALEAYRKRDFETALREAAPNDHFFVGVCWLQLNNAHKALAEFEQAALQDNEISDEFFYYKGVALQDLGREEEAKQAFQRVLESKMVREPFRIGTAKRINK